MEILQGGGDVGGGPHEPALGFGFGFGHVEAELLLNVEQLASEVGPVFGCHLGLSLFSMTNVATMARSRARLSMASYGVTVALAGVRA